MVSEAAPVPPRGRRRPCTGSFEDFFRGHYPVLVAKLRQLGFGNEDSEDMAQEAMLDARRRWDQIDYPEKWVWTNAFRRMCRKRRRDRIELPAETADAPGGADPADVVEIGEQRHRLTRLLARLPARCRVVVVLDLAGFTSAEIAEITGMSQSTVRSQLRHGRAKLKRWYEGGFA